MKGGSEDALFGRNRRGLQPSSRDLGLTGAYKPFRRDPSN